MICPNCQREVPDTAKACGYCGHWLASTDPFKPAGTASEAEVTHQPPNPKSTLPWLWIGLGVTVLVIIVGIFAFLVGRGGAVNTEIADNSKSVDVKATVAAAIATEQAKTKTSQPADAATPASTRTPTAAIESNPKNVKSTYLAQLKPKTVEVGYQKLSIGKYEFTSSDDGVRRGDPIMVDKVEYPQGLFAHAPSRIVYELDKKFSKLFVTIGMAEQVQCGDGAEFIIMVDGYQVFHSKKMFSFSNPEEVQISVANGKQLVLITNPGVANNNDCDWTVWGDPLLTAGLSDTTSEASSLFDNFNNLTYEGKFNPTLWSPELPPPCAVTQQNGAMIFNTESSQDAADCRLYVNPRSVSINELTKLEARIQIANNHKGEYVNQGLEFATSNSPQGYWASFCGLKSDESGNAGAEFSVWSERGGDEKHEEVSIEFDQWYILRLELEPDTMMIKCSIDDNLIGSTIPKDAQVLKKLHFERYLNMYRSTGSIATSFVDDVHILP